MSEQLILWLDDPRDAREKKTERRTLWMTGDLWARIVLLGRDYGIHSDRHPDLLRAVLRLGVEVAEVATLENRMIVDDTPARFSAYVQDELRKLRETLEAAA